MDSHRFVQWLCASCFKVSNGNDLLFYPWGPGGRGYRIATRREWERLHRTVLLIPLAGCASMVLLGWCVNVLTGRSGFSLTVWVSSSVAVLAAVVLWLRRLVRKFEPVAERLTFREASEQRRAVMTPDLMIFLVALPTSLAILPLAILAWDIGRAWALPASVLAAGGFAVSIWSFRRSSVRGRN